MKIRTEPPKVNGNTSTELPITAKDKVAPHHKDIPEAESGLVRPKNPWWIPRMVFGRMPRIQPQLVTLLGCVSIALFYENYDLSLLNVSLKHIGETLKIDETEFGFFTAKIRFGSLFALLVIPFIDLIGRRRLILLSIIGMSVATCLTAFSQTPEQFVRFQILSRVFILTASATALVIIAEEFPAKKRGWAIGMLAVAAVIGHGFGALFFAAIDWIPYGWRALYFIGIIPVFRMPMFRRGIYETRLFQQQQGGRLKGRLSAFVNWFRPYQTDKRAIRSHLLPYNGSVLWLRTRRPPRPSRDNSCQAPYPGWRRPAGLGNGKSPRASW